MPDLAWTILSVQWVGDSGHAVGYLHFMGEEPTEALLVSLLRGED